MCELYLVMRLFVMMPSWLVADVVTKLHCHVCSKMLLHLTFEVLYSNSLADKIHACQVVHLCSCAVK